MQLSFALRSRLSLSLCPLPLDDGTPLCVSNVKAPWVRSQRVHRGSRVHDNFAHGRELSIYSRPGASQKSFFSYSHMERRYLQRTAGTGSQILMVFAVIHVGGPSRESLCWPLTLQAPSDVLDHVGQGKAAWMAAWTHCRAFSGSGPHSKLADY